MSKHKSIGRERKIDILSKAGWDGAIADADKLIREYQDEINLLKSSIRSFKTLRELARRFQGLLSQNRNF